MLFWGPKDARLQTQQKVSLDQDKKRSYLAVFESLWDLLDELLVTMDTNTSDLLDTIELYVAVLTMVTFYMLVKHVKPPCHNLGVIQRVATTVQVLPRHGTDSFRLNLLEMALEHVLLVLRTMDGTSEELC